MKKCPYCDYRNVGEELRCPKCRQGLTLWRNFEDYGRQAYQAGLHAVAQEQPLEAVELFARAALFAPDEATYLDAYGRLLGRLGRYSEAMHILERACDQIQGEGARAPLEKARSLAAAQASDEAEDEEEEAEDQGEGEGEGENEAEDEGSSSHV